MDRCFPPLDCLTCVFVPLSFILTYTIYTTCMQTKRRSEHVWRMMAQKSQSERDAGIGPKWSATVLPYGPPIRLPIRLRERTWAAAPCQSDCKGQLGPARLWSARRCPTTSREPMR